jgi:uracil-DNA glycosylase family 4
MEQAHQPLHDCPLCPRLAEFRQRNRAEHPDFFNAPVPSFGSLDAPLLIVGLAPGLKGANRTGRPFTGDFAGDLLYATLKKFGWATGEYGREPDDGLQLVDCRITNAVRCVPPENKPTPLEISACRPFLVEEIANLPKLRAILALGSIAHGSVLRTLGERLASHPFKHGAIYTMKNGLLLADSYHCSRYNTNTGKLTEAMFEAVFAGLRKRLG